MKKLIAMIGAVATAFGLYATDLTKSAVSFETAEPGCSGETFNWQADGMWATDYDDVFKFGAVADETTYAGAYTGTTRRNDEFTYGQSQNDQFLKLSMGTNTLQRLFAAEGAEVSTDPIFIDQLVKFTGYEDTQTVFAAGTKVAVWMSEFVTNEVNNVEQTLTNLYVAVGSVSGGNVTMKNVKIAGDYQLDKWYRLTIRSIGNIYGAGAVPSALSGFAIYINGAAIVISQEDQGLLDNADALIPKAAVLYSKGQLFPSMVAGSTTLKSVGFEGMGGIDDMIVDAVGPDFAQEANFDFAEITGAQVLVVSNMTENTELVADANGLYTAIPGQLIRVYFTANGPYVLKPDPTFRDFNAVAGNTTKAFTDDEVVEPDEAVAQIDGDTPIYFVTMAEAFAAAAPYDTITVLQDSAPYEPVADAGMFLFPINAQIAIGENGLDWNVTLANPETDFLTDMYGAAEGQSIVVMGNLILTAGIPANASIYVSGVTQLSADIALNGEFQTLALANAITEEEAVIGYNKMTLGVKGAYQQFEKIETLANFFGNEDLTKINETEITEEGEEGPETIGWKYTLKGGVEFTLTAPDNTTITGVSGAEPVAGKDNTYTAEDGAEVTVTLKADEGYLFENKTDTTTETFEAAAGEITLQTAAPAAAPVKKGGKFFITLQDAIDAEDSEELEADNTVYVLDNIALEARVNINKDAVIDLGAKTLTSTTAGYTDTSFLVKIANDADVTIKNGAVAATAAAKPNCGIWVDGGELDLVDVDVTAPLKAVQVTKTSALTVDADSVVTGTGDDSAIFINTQNGDTTILAPSTVTIAGTVKNTYAAAATADSTNYAISGNGKDKAGANVVIADGAVVQSDTLTAIFFPCAGTLTVNGGTITGCEFGIYAKSGTVTINDGEITATTTTVVPVSVDNDGYTGAGYAVCLETGSEQGGYANNLSFAVYGGKFTSEGAAVYNFVREGADPIAPGITAGAFKAMPDVALIATTAGQSAKWVLNEETGYYEPSIATMVCQIGTTQYATLAEAIDAVPADGEWAKIQIIADFTDEVAADTTIPVGAGKAIEIDLNGHTITVNKTTGDSGIWLSIPDGTEVWLWDSSEAETGKIVFAGDATPAKDWSSYAYLIQNNGYLTIENGTYEANLNGCWIGYILQQQVHTRGHSVFDFLGGTIANHANDQAIRFYNNSASAPNSNTINIKGGEITEGGIFVDNCGSTVVSEINITAGGVAGLIDFNTVGDNLKINFKGGESNLSKIKVRDNCSNTEPIITFKGGTINLAATEILCANAPIAVKGGTFNATGYGLVQDMLASENYAWRDNEDTTYTAYAQYVAQIAGDSPVKYGTLKDAIEAAVDGDVVELVADSSFEFDGTYVTVAAGKAITLDLMGCEIKGVTPDGDSGKNMIYVDRGAELTFRDSVGGGLYEYYHNNVNQYYQSGCNAIYNKGVLNIESGYILAYDNAGDLVYGIENDAHLGSATLNISGGTIEVPDFYGQSCFRAHTYDQSGIMGTNFVNISGGTFKNCYPMSIAAQGTTQQTPVKVNISGGTFEGYCRFYAWSADTEIKISGGKFVDGVYPNYSIAYSDNRADKSKPYVFIEGGEFDVNQFAGASAQNTLVRGGTFNKVGHAATNPQDIEQLLGVDCLAVYAEKKDAETDGFFTVELIPVDLNIAAGTGVESFTYTVNDDEPVGGQQVKFGDVIKITNVVYADGYAEGEIKKDTEITVGEDLLVDETGALVDAVVVTVDAVRGAAKKGLKVFITLQEALDDTEETGDIVLLKDVTADGVEVAAAAAIDMAGYTLSVSEGETLTLGDAVTLKNSVAGQGGFLNAGTIAINADQDFSNLAWGAGGFIDAGAGTSAKLAIAADATVKMPTATVDLDPNQMATVTPGFWDGTATGAKVFAAANMWKYNGATWDAAVATVNDAYFFTVADALAAVQAAEEAKLFPISVVALADGLVIPGPDSQSITLAKNGTITIKADSWAFAPAPVITKVVLVEGKKLVFPTAIANYKTVILCADGYKVVETAVDGGFEYTVAECTYVAQIGEQGYETFEAAVLALKDDDKLELLDNVTLAAANTISAKNVTLDLGGFTVTEPNGIGTFTLAEGSSVTLTNGVINLKTGTTGTGIAVYGDLVVECTINAATDSQAWNPVFDIYPAAGTITVGDEADLTSNSDVFRFKKDNNEATLTINGGVMKGGNGNGIIAVYKPNNMPTININGGTFALVSESANCGIVKASGVSTAVPTVNVTGGEFATTDNFITEDGATITLTLGADAAAAKFATDTNLKAYCDTGYFAKKVEDWYQIALAKTVTSLTLNETAVEMAPEATTNLTATIEPNDADIVSTEWTSSAEGVATVSAEGVVTAVADGSATITYTVVDVLDNTNTVSCAVTVKTASSDPIPPVTPKDDGEVAKILDDLVDGDALKAIVKTPEQYTAFQTWAHTVDGGSQAVALSPNAAVSFELSPIVATATLFENEPAVKFTAIAQSGTDWNATLQIKDGATGEEVKLAVEEAVAAYQNFVKVGSVVTDITQTATIKATAADGNKVILTVTPPTGDAGFIKFTTAK